MKTDWQGRARGVVFELHSVGTGEPPKVSEQEGRWLECAVEGGHGRERAGTGKGQQGSSNRPGYKQGGSNRNAKELPCRRQDGVTSR